MNDGLFFTVEEAAEKLHVHPETIRRRIRNGKLKAQIIDGDRGKQYSIPASALSIQDAVPIPEQKLAQPILEQIVTANTKAIQELLTAQFALQEEKNMRTIQSMENEITSLRNEIQALQKENMQMIHLLSEPPKKSSFWKKWFS